MWYEKNGLICIIHDLLKLKHKARPGNTGLGKKMNRPVRICDLVGNDFVTAKYLLAQLRIIAVFTGCSLR